MLEKQICKNIERKLYNFRNAFVLLKGTSYNKERKREAENERSQNGDEKALSADSGPDPKFFIKYFEIGEDIHVLVDINNKSYASSKLNTYLFPIN